MVVWCWASVIDGGPTLQQHLVSIFAGIWARRDANTIYWPNICLMQAQRLRRWPSIKPSLGQHLVSAALYSRWMYNTVFTFHTGRGLRPWWTPCGIGRARSERQHVHSVLCPETARIRKPAPEKHHHITHSPSRLLRHLHAARRRYHHRTKTAGEWRLRLPRSQRHANSGFCSHHWHHGEDNARVWFWDSSAAQRRAARQW